MQLLAVRADRSRLLRDQVHQICNRHGNDALMEMGQEERETVVGETIPARPTARVQHEAGQARLNEIQLVHAVRQTRVAKTRVDEVEGLGLTRKAMANVIRRLLHEHAVPRERLVDSIEINQLLFDLVVAPPHQTLPLRTPVQRSMHHALLPAGLLFALHDPAQILRRQVRRHQVGVARVGLETARLLEHTQEEAARVLVVRQNTHAAIEVVCRRLLRRRGEHGRAIQRALTLRD